MLHWKKRIEKTVSTATGNSLNTFSPVKLWKISRSIPSLSPVHRLYFEQLVAAQGRSTNAQAVEHNRHFLPFGGRSRPSIA